MQFIRFVIVGVVNTAFSYGVYALLVYLGMNFVLANLCALLLGIAFSFKTQSALVFANQDARRFLRFVIAWALIYTISVFLISRFVALGFDAYLSGALAIPFTTILAFLVQKYFVFRRPHASAS